MMEPPIGEQLGASKPARGTFVEMTVAALILGCAVVIASIGPARADLPPVFAGNVIVAGAFATPAEIGGSSRLGLRIENDTARGFHLMGVQTPVSPATRIVARLSSVETTTLDSMVIPADGVLDLDTTQIWIALDDLTAPLAVGDKFPAELILHFSTSTATMAIQVHVHENPVQ